MAGSLLGLTKYGDRLTVRSVDSTCQCLYISKLLHQLGIVLQDLKRESWGERCDFGGGGGLASNSSNPVSEVVIRPIS